MARWERYARRFVVLLSAPPDDSAGMDSNPTFSGSLCAPRLHCRWHPGARSQPFRVESKAHADGNAGLQSRRSILQLCHSTGRMDGPAPDGLPSGRLTSGGQGENESRRIGPRHPAGTRGSTVSPLTQGQPADYHRLRADGRQIQSATLHLTAMTGSVVRSPTGELLTSCHQPRADGGSTHQSRDGPSETAGSPRERLPAGMTG